MKTKTFLLLCLFLGIGLTQLSAQQDGKAISHYGQESMPVPLTCDVNTPPVILWADLDFHCVMFNTGPESNYDQLWMKMRYKGTVTNPITKEVFTVDEVVTNGHFKIGTANTDPNYYSDIKFVTKLKGSLGSHIIISGTWDMVLDSDWNIVGWIFTIDKAKCN